MFAAVALGGDFAAVRASATVVHVEPFSSARKSMAVALALPGGGVRVLVKGAAEIVLHACVSQLSPDGSAAPLLKAESGGANGGTALEDMIASYAGSALRALLLAYRDYPAESGAEVVQDLAGGKFKYDGLTAVALVGIKDPCRPGVPDAVAACRAAGIVVRMVTGDSIATGKAIAEECGIYDAARGDEAIEGPVFRQMTDAQRRSVRLFP